MNDKTSPLRLPPEEAGRLMRLATYASVSVAAVLILAKFAAWTQSGSVSLLASLVDSTLDALASLVNLFAVRHSLSPADREHRFGHGKAEALAALGQAALISASAVFLLYESVGRLLSPVEIQSYQSAVWVIVLAIAMTLGLLGFQRYVIQRTDSTAIKADALHYRSDLLVNTSVLLALALSYWGWPGFDALFALLIALYILYSAWEIVRGAFDHLMDRELPDSERQDILLIATSQSGVRGVHDLRTRRSGTDTFMQMHIELDDDLQLLQAHTIAEQVEAAVLAAFPGAEVIIHLDPLSVVGDDVRRH
ncbi:cation diffusion facilitator family transporter [Pseudohalioglobus sediminis]|uniref:Cation-efflux pump FieF n=1 Tax=Pseudohalioglobus sediminis TaxID=2606449 RepID=A0A5B0WUT4_9GAMM|nr:cation diffusion facilitator family transporter [Pseudohalioglobus sediminis]KAA1190055.1 cation diffusion facilitator family transporter [Pseudohalioglobus sediminis]